MMKGTMTNSDIINKLCEMLSDSGYIYEYSKEDGWLECVVDGMLFAAYAPEDDLFGYSCQFDFKNSLSDADKENIARMFDKEEPVIFENLHFSDDGVLITTVLPTEFYDEDLLDKVIRSLRQSGGLMEYLKTNSTKYDRRRNMMNFNKVMEKAEQRLSSLGYSPKHNYDDQLDCIINGISFAIYGSDDGKTFGFGCIFEPATDKYAESFLEELKARFDGKYAPFQNLLMCEDGFLHLEAENNEYTDSLIDAIVNSLLDTDGVASAIKAESYVWEDK